jgi:hypothetical protein
MDADELERAKTDPFFAHSEPLEGGFYEVTFNKKRIVHALNTLLGWNVYNYAKLFILQFQKDFLEFYFDKKDYELVLMDTDSMYVAFSNKDWESLVKPHRKAHYLENRHKWLPSKDLAQSKFDSRTPGLFHVEFEGTCVIALSPKTYYAEGPDPKNPDGIIIKMSTKGLPKRQNNITKQDFLQVLKTGISKSGIVKNFRVHRGRFGRMNLRRNALGNLYIKRQVRPDGIHTRPLVNV